MPDINCSCLSQSSLMWILPAAVKTWHVSRMVNHQWMSCQLVDFSLCIYISDAFSKEVMEMLSVTCWETSCSTLRIVIRNKISCGKQRYRQGWWEKIIYASSKVATWWSAEPGSPALGNQRCLPLESLPCTPFQVVTSGHVVIWETSPPSALTDFHWDACQLTLLRIEH
ncbi:hypothetical protein OUZ56_028129 [Daphnia magna]|uniref:Uncharacterized protein n=1 Tax=Daphnia magna TaxID=35525 RepID=A0ABR0B2Z2_9CRUS|nr:hypothetical protein OUZ56_028129 [Daphnia magna]